MKRDPLPTKRLQTLRPRISTPLLFGYGFLALAAGYPVILLFAQSLWPNLPAGKLDGFFQPYLEIIRTEGVPEMLWNSLAWACATTSVAWVLGIPIGWLLARTRLPAKGFARLTLLAPVMTPPYIAALSYILIMQPQGLGDSVTGGIPAGLQQWFFSFWGVTLVMALSSFGYIALAVEAALLKIPARLEEAANQLGARPLQTARLVLFPLMLPAILNAGLLVFLEALSNFGVPAVLGTRANLPLLPAEIFYLLTSWPLDLPLATALSGLLCLFALVALFTSRRLTASIDGGLRGEQAALSHLSMRSIVIAWTGIGTVFFLSTVLPYAAMIHTSLTSPTAAGGYAFTLSHYSAIFSRGSEGIAALTTSMVLSLSAATICVLIGGYLAYVISRTGGWNQKVLESMATLPRVLPKIVMAVGLILAWNAPWIPVGIYNTVWMLLLAYVVIYITDALNFGNSAMRTLPINLENAATSLGAGRLRVFFTIVIPQLKPALIAAWVTTFIVCMRELVASLLLLPPGVNTTATFIFNQFEQGDISIAMAMATVTIVTTTIVLIAFRYGKSIRDAGNKQ